MTIYQMRPAPTLKLRAGFGPAQPVSTGLSPPEGGRSMGRAI